MLGCLSLYCFMLFGPPSLALDKATQGAAPAAPSIQAFGRSNACASWTDGCTVCTRGTNAAACSTPGIACTPAAITCAAPTP